jgi:hypothetical protein
MAKNRQDNNGQDFTNDNNDINDGDTNVAVQERMTTVLPFTIEADHPRNCDLLIQSIPGCRLRSIIDGARPVIDKNGDARIPVDQAKGMASFPRTPGMRVFVNPQEREVIITDPLTENEQLLERVRKAINQQTGIRNDTKIRGVDTRREKLDEHRIKTLCRELRDLLDVKHVKMVSGPEPTREAIQQMPGKFLLNPGSTVPNTQPRFEDDYSSWLDQLVRSGG